MKFTVLILLVFGLFNSCNKETPAEKFRRECPYLPEYRIPRHQFTIPVTITPNKSNYNIGDTINIDATFSNLMYDYNTMQNFVIKKFPFDVGVKLWKFVDTTAFQNGFGENEYIMDTAYFQKLDYSGDKTDVIFIDFVETEKEYQFNMKIVLKKKGKYIFQFEDYIHRYPEDLYVTKIGPYTFDGKCPTFGVQPIAMIQGDDHLSQFETELLHIDKKVSFDNWTTIKVKSAHESPYGRGTSKWEFAGTYGFEVK